MRPLPSSWDEVTLAHRIVYYTFLPVVGLSFICLVGTIPLYLTGLLTFSGAIVFPWVVFGFVTVYIALLGDYVMPAETYRKYRSGEWGER